MVVHLGERCGAQSNFYINGHPAECIEAVSVCLDCLAMNIESIECVAFFILGVEPDTRSVAWDWTPGNWIAFSVYQASAKLLGGMEV